jgi:gamma-tubulin complex component 2
MRFTTLALTPSRTSDPAAHQLYRDLLLHASRPYTQMLERWATKGHLHDPYDEFMVKENKFINRGTLEMDYTDEYWDRRYTVGWRSALTYQRITH